MFSVFIFHYNRGDLGNTTPHHEWRGLKSNRAIYSEMEGETEQDSVGPSRVQILSMSPFFLL